MAIIDRIFRIDARIDRAGKPFFLNGKENVRSAVENRFAVFQKSIPFLPRYGAILKKYQGRNLDPDTINQVRQEVNNQLLRDTRVESIKTL